MKKKQRGKLRILLFILVGINLWILSYISKNNQQNTAGQTEEEDYINQVQEEQERIAEPIEEFGAFLEEIHITGQKSILENYVISRVLESEEIDWLVENSSGLIHLEIEKNSPLRSCENWGGRTVISADVDGDGIEDIITSNYDDYRRENLYIYLGLTNGDYQLSYAQPTLRIKEYDHLAKYEGFYRLEVVRYKEESYLLFRVGCEYYLRGAHLSEGKVKEGFVFEYWCENVNSEGMHTEELLGSTEESRMRRIRWFSDDDLYHHIYARQHEDHCDIYDPFDDEVWEELENGEEEIIEEERKQQIFDQYQRRQGEEIKPVYKASGHFYRSDINNDGIEEEYYKDRNWISAIFFDGRYYANYVNGGELSYYMETGGEETDFEKMCGLALWNQGMIPFYFFVQEGEEGNITYIAYRDRNDHKMRLDGYLIQSDHYERVASMSLVPEIACRMNHWSDPYTENAGYFIFYSKDMKSIEFLYAEESSMEDQVNQNIRRLLETKAEELREEKNSFLRVHYKISKTTKESAKLECDVVYWDEEEGDEVHSGSFYFIVDMTTGEIKEVEREEVW